MKKTAIFVILLTLPAAGAAAQDYHSGIGLRAGLFNGLTAKHFLTEQYAAEVLLTTRWNGFNLVLTGLYEAHFDDLDPERLRWFYGFGCHVGFWSGDDVTWTDPGDSHVVVGADGIVGIEYAFEEMPVALSLDWKPTLNLIGWSGRWVDAFALSIRYTFWH